MSRHTNQNRTGFLPSEICDPNDYQFLESVIEDSSQVLTRAIHLADQRVLRYAPARATSRIISASIFLLKAIGIGAGATRLKTSLDLLQRTITALRSSAVDEVDLGLQYASLLEMHLSQVKGSFVTSAVPPGTTQGDAMMSEDPTGVGSMNPEDWFSLPFEFNTVYNGLDDLQGFSSFEDGDLDFIWNLNTNSQGK